MSRFEKRKAIVKIGGDYCAWHEVNLDCEYVYGSTYMGYSFHDYCCDNIEGELGVEFESLEDLDVLLKTINSTRLDKIADEFLDKQEFSGYCDYTVKEILVEIDENEKIKNTFLSI